MFTVFILRRSKFTQDVLDRYNIYFSNFFRQFVSFNPAVIYWYPKAVTRIVEFGDLTLDEELSKAIYRPKKPKPHG
jgi:hypothetical protein